MTGVGVIAIGRNEGERLRKCLASAIGRAQIVVYVDSNSSDGSVALARQMGANVVELDMSIPFTAARARNEGFARLMQMQPVIEFVQFVDGDCEIVDGWMELAADELRAHPDWAIVCGRRRERYPDATIYNRLCDIEWNTPVGEASACGGDAMIRASAFRQINGYDASVIAGEEPEMCVRLRRHNWKIFRLDAEMTLHDAAMTTFGQWWKRNVRAGHAYAEGAAMHGRGPARHWVRETRSNWLWGFAIPLLAIAPAWPTYGTSLILFLAYAPLFHRIRRSMLKSNKGSRPLYLETGDKRDADANKGDANLYSLFTVIGKFPQALGQLKFTWNRLLGRRSRLIEYKGAAPLAT